MGRGRAFDYWEWRLRRETLWAYTESLFANERGDPPIALASGYVRRWPIESQLIRYRVWRWTGRLPHVGDFFLARRSWVAFEIVEVRRCETAAFAVVCRRWNAERVPNGRRMHLWQSHP